jgi:hypothetical protein
MVDNGLRYKLEGKQQKVRKVLIDSFKWLRPSLTSGHKKAAPESRFWKLS